MFRPDGKIRQIGLKYFKQLNFINPQITLETHHCSKKKNHTNIYRKEKPAEIQHCHKHAKTTSSHFGRKTAQRRRQKGLCVGGQSADVRHAGVYVQCEVPCLPSNCRYDQPGHGVRKYLRCVAKMPSFPLIIAKYVYRKKCNLWSLSDRCSTRDVDNDITTKLYLIYFSRDVNLDKKESSGENIVGAIYILCEAPIERSLIE